MEHKCKKTDLKTVEKCELNAEQIIKALECCSSGGGVSACESGCPYWCGDYDTCPCVEDPDFIVKNALALINSQEQRIKELTEEIERLRADNVSEIKTRFAMRFGTYTDKDMTPITEVFWLLDQIEKEMLEEHNDTRE